MECINFAENNNDIDDKAKLETIVKQLKLLRNQNAVQERGNHKLEVEVSESTIKKSSNSYFPPQV
jgi:hypothetical protein